MMCEMSKCGGVLLYMKNNFAILDLNVISEPGMNNLDVREKNWRRLRKV